MEKVSRNWFLDKGFEENHNEWTEYVGRDLMNEKKTIYFLQDKKKKIIVNFENHHLTNKVTNNTRKWYSYYAVNQKIGLVVENRITYRKPTVEQFEYILKLMGL